MLSTTTLAKGKGTAVNSKQHCSAEDLKRIITRQQREITVLNERLKGVEDLIKICHESEEERKHWQTKAENLEDSLRRCEARIAYLNKKLGIGPQTAFKLDVVNPGVSRKDFDAVTRENIKLREALEHIVPTELGGEDVVLKNRELYELVTTLQSDLAQRDHHINELEVVLANKGDRMAVKVNELTKDNLKLERSMKAKQVFSEKLLKEIKKLRIVGEKSDQDVVMKEDVLDGKTRDNVKTQVPEVPTVAGTNDLFNKEQSEKLKKEIEEKDKTISEQAAAMQVMQEEIERFSTQVTELTKNLERASEKQTRTDSELSETVKKCADFQKKCQGFFKQVVGLNAKQQDAEQEIAALKRANENLRTEVAERNAMNTMMTDSLKMHEEDFKREHEDRMSTKKRLESTQQEGERLRRENQSHMATIRHFESEIERMSKLMNEERIKAKGTGSSAFQTPFGQGCGSRSIFQDHRPQQVVADGGVNEVDSASRAKSAYSMPSSKPEPPKSTSPTLIECPYCSRSYPYHLIEGHVQDCMEDSLYMDD